jgi:hypothetical protein
MLDQQAVDKFTDEMTMQNVNAADLEWMIKQVGAHSIQELTEHNAYRIQKFAELRRKYGQTLAEQWVNFNYF